MTESPRVAIIIPAFNAAPTIEGAITSALGQTLTDIEVLVVDDASTDGTATVARRMAATDLRLRYLQQPVNRGPAAARNRGLEATAASWVALLDADDRFQPDRIERLLALAAERGADIVADNLLLVSDGGAFAPLPMIPESLLAAPKPLTLAEFVTLNEGRFDRAARARPRFSYGFLKPVIRSAFLAANGLRYDERNRYAEDYMFAVRCLEHGAAWWLTPDTLYRYAVRDGSATHVQSAEDLSRVVAFDREHLAVPAVAQDSALAQAFYRHLRSVERRFHYRRFVNAVKGRRYGQAAGLFLENGTSAADVVRILFWNTRAIVTKAARGGYRSRPPGTGKENHP